MCLLSALRRFGVHFLEVAFRVVCAHRGLLVPLGSWLRCVRRLAELGELVRHPLQEVHEHT